MSITDTIATERRAALPAHVAEALERMVAILVERFDPDQIILFGSYARGTAGPDSDVDLLIVMPMDRASRNDTIADVYGAVPACGIGRDIVVYSSERFNEYRDVVGTVVYPAVREGVVLYRRQPSRVREEPGVWDRAGVVKRLVRMWAEKAEHDWQAVVHLRSAEPPLADIICFHAQQCAEKYLKTVLVARQVPFGKTHKFKEIFELMPEDVHLGIGADELEVLEPCGVDVRYPEDGPVDLQAAVAAATNVRTSLRAVLGEWLEGQGAPFDAQTLP